jgi:hopanoid biosynthesis associated protein HpnK
MAARLILNADDFGLTPGVNRAIAELHAAGALTSATLMATGAAFEDAVAIAKANPNLGVGCHIVLTDGIPVMPPHSIPTLLGPDGRTFRPKLTSFIRDLFLGRIRQAEIQKEVVAQIRVLQKAGIRPTHLDSHKHTHLFPAVTTSLTNAAQRTKVQAIRNPFEPTFARQVADAPLKRRLQIDLLKLFKSSYERRATHIRATDGTIGISATGSLNAETLRDTLATLPFEGTFELLCHPGYNDADLGRVTTRLRNHREVEYRALLEQIPLLRSQPNAPHLIHYGDL